MPRIDRTLLTLALTATIAQAQTWQPIGTADNGNHGAYWNNASNDNIGTAVCNIGAIATNLPALTTTSCSNRTPGGMLPITPPLLSPANTFLGGIGGTNPGAFRFSAGTYSFELVGRVAGDVSTTWGVVLDNGTVFTAAQLAAGPTALTGPFAFWITQSLPAAGAGTIYTSAQSTGAVAIGASGATINQQFVVFSGTYGPGTAGLTTDAFGTIINTGGAFFYVGMEDNVNGGRGFGVAGPGPVSDRDYNDVVIRFGMLPEPATNAMLACGALLLGVVQWRRSRAAART